MQTQNEFKSIKPRRKSTQGHICTPMLTLSMKHSAFDDLKTDRFTDVCCCNFRNNMGRAVRGVLTRAKVERRLICGLLPAISYLEKNPDDVLICVIPETRPGDAATHMQTVLLQAFCYENYIPVIQVGCNFQVFLKDVNAAVLCDDPVMR